MRQIGPGSPFFFVVFPKHMKRLIVIHTCLGGLVLYVLYRAGFFTSLALSLRSDIDRADLLSHFPETKADGSRLAWAHAVNSRAELKEAIKSDRHMVESDIILGADGTPIMAHPPAVTSDLPFSVWLAALGGLAKKGKKLDFKGIAAVRPCLQQMSRLGSGLRGPVVVNADVLRGPNAAPSDEGLPPVPFIRLWSELLPSSLLSLGWRTRDGPEGYSWAHVFAMASVLRSAGVTDGQRVTFAVRASLLHPGSVLRLRWLLDTLPGASLTVWGARGDRRQTASDLLLLRHLLPASKVFHDLDFFPAPVLDEFRRLSDRPQRLVSMFQDLLGNEAPLERNWDLLVNSDSAAHAEGTPLALPGTTSLLMKGPSAILVSRTEVSASPEHSVRLRLTVHADSPCQVQVGLRGKQFVSSVTVNADGVVSLLQLGTGRMAIQTSGGRDVTQVEDRLEGVTLGSDTAFRLSVEDDGGRVVFTVTAVHRYNTHEPVIKSSRRLVLATKLNSGSQSRPVILLRWESSSTLLAVHDLKLVVM